MARKTVDIKDLIEIVNHRNRESTCSPETRKGWNSLLERVLHDGGVYDGFNYLQGSEVPAGQLPGVIHDRAYMDASNEERESMKPDHKFPDETRRSYYTHRKLR